MKWFRVETNHVDNDKIWDLFETHGVSGYGFYFWLINALHKQEESGYQIELTRSEEHTSELQSPCNLVCRLLLEKKKHKQKKKK